MWSRVVAGVAASLVLGGCAGTATTPTRTPEPRNVAFVQVENQSWTDFSIFVLWEGSRQRVGRATANTTAAYRIPERFLTNDRGSWVQFLVDPIGPPAGPLSRRLRVFRGDTVHIIIPPE